MKHLLNNMSEEEKNAIREQHTGGMKVITENFYKLLGSKLGDVKPLITEQSPVLGGTRPSVPQKPVTPGLNYKNLADTLDKAMRGAGTDENSIKSVLNQLKTYEDFKNLSNAFGIRDGQNLSQWIAGETSVFGEDLLNFMGTFNTRMGGALRTQLNKSPASHPVPKQVALSR